MNRRIICRSIHFPSNTWECVYCPICDPVARYNLNYRGYKLEKQMDCYAPCQFYRHKENIERAKNEQQPIG